jgi:hypothetical protein
MRTNKQKQINSIKDEVIDKNQIHYRRVNGYYVFEDF